MSNNASVSFWGHDVLIKVSTIQIQESGSYSMRLYERIEFGGKVMDLMEDCPSVMDRFHINNIFSCNVRDGNWLFYEHPNYHGRMFLIRPGEYRRFTEWGGRSARVGSIKRIMDSWPAVEDQ